MSRTVRNLLTGPAQVGTGFLVLFTLTGFPQVDPAANDHTFMPVGRQNALATTLVPRLELEGDWVVYERLEDLDLTHGSVATVRGHRTADGGCEFSESRSAATPVVGVMAKEIAYNPSTCQSRVYERSLTAKEAEHRRSDPHAEHNAERSWWGLPPLVEEKAPAAYLGPAGEDQ